MSNISRDVFEDAVHNVKRYAKIGLHFHPDRLLPNMKSVAESLLEKGEYKSQFETFISNGSVSAYSGGARDMWEKDLFGGAYQTAGSLLSERPKYGALNLMLHPDGPSPRFGSCYLLLSPNVSHRATYTYLDSHQNPSEKGTFKQFDMVLAALLEEVFSRDFAIGEKDLTPAKLINHFMHNLDRDSKNVSHKTASRNLNHYIEAQVHGPVSLNEDTDVLVADPCFKNTKTGNILNDICLAFSIELVWHMGFTLKTDDVPYNFRGPTMPSLAKRISHGDTIDASKIGLAAKSLKEHPHSWEDRGHYDDVLQELKLLWHVLVKFGKPL